MSYELCHEFYQGISQPNLNCSLRLQRRYLQNNSLTGTLNLVAMNRAGLLRRMSDNSTEKLEIMDLSNNGITNVIYNEFTIQNISTVFKYVTNWVGFAIQLSFI